MKTIAMNVLFILLFHQSLLVKALTADGVALLAFRKHLKDHANVLRNWKVTDRTPCRWTGVQCNEKTGRVEVLNLPRSHLRGTISSDIGKLDQLRRLGLHNNNLEGPVPSSLGNCTELRAIYLRNNFLSGSLPSELGMLDNLRVLDLSQNTLTGSIPSSFERLTNLFVLNVSNNLLTGSVDGLSKFSSNSFAGNSGLCGRQLNKSCEAPPATPTGFRTSKLSRNLMITALGTVTASLCIALLCFWGFLIYNKLDFKACESQLVEPSEGTTAKLVLFHGDLPCSPKDIIKRLEQLDYKDIIGAGGFGTVYRLSLGDGRLFAVKKIAKTNESLSEKLFEKELDVLGSIEHRNLVTLRGYCNAPAARLLISDYLPYGSLDEILHEKNAKESMLTWDVRLNIAVGAARGLAHLHHDCIPPIIHRDVKSSNILLDDDLEAHVSDFGLAKLLEENDSQVTTIVAGTFGYLAPEYMQSGRATEKSDVYSYGVVLLELLSGKKPTDVYFTAKGLNIVGWASAMIRQNRCLEIFDPHCRGAQLESMEALLQVAGSCISPRPEARPDMLTVCNILEEQLLCSSSSTFYNSSE